MKPIFHETEFVLILNYSSNIRLRDYLSYVNNRFYLLPTITFHVIFYFSFIRIIYSWQKLEKEHIRNMRLYERENSAETAHSSSEVHDFEKEARCISNPIFHLFLRKSISEVSSGMKGPDHHWTIELRDD